jgi:Ca-activated chloride channel family protein
MSFLDPAALWLAALAVPLVLLYFIRARRRDRQVPSLLLWRVELRERASTSRFQRLQLDPLLILQLLALAAIVMAVARPAVTVLGEGERKVVVVLDTSASMKARDVSPSRFAEAQSRAASFVRSLRPGTQVMVIEAGIQPRIASEMDKDFARAIDAIDASHAHDIPSGLPDALRIARALIGDDQRAEVHVFTDGALSEVPAADDARIRWVGVGRTDDNVGITQLAVRRTYQGASSYEAFLSLANFSSKPRNFAFSVKVDDRTVAERQVALGAGVHRSLILPFRHTGAARVTAQLRVDDALAVDNVAYAVLPPPTKIAVMLVSPGNLFLEKVLRSNPEVALELKHPGQYTGGMGTADVVVLDSVTPKAVGNGRFVFVNTIPPDVPVDLLGVVEKPNVMDWDRSHPVMRHVDFSKVAIQSSIRMRPLAAGRALVEGELGGPLIYALEEPERKAVLVGFDLFKADLPLRVAFPLIMSNALHWLHPGKLDHSSLQLPTGQPVVMPLAHSVDSVRVTTPGGRTVNGRVTRGIGSFTDTAEVGVYTLATSRGENRIAVNLMDGGESDIAPRPLPAPAEASTPTEVPVQQEIWQAFIGLALLLLVAEALLYWRRQGGGRFRLLADKGDQLALGLRCALLALLVSTYARPTLPHTLDRMNVVFLLDQSESVSRAARERAESFVDQALESRKAGDRHGIVVFGGDAAVLQPLGSSDAAEPLATRIDSRGTNIYQAIQLALAMLPAGQPNRIVLASDGRQNAGNAFSGAQAIKDTGTDLHYVPAPLTSEQEVVAEELVMPREVKFGEPFHARLVVWSQKAGAGRVSLFRNGQFIGAQKVQVSAGKNVFSYRQSLDREGIHVYQAAIDVDGDTIEENNRAVGTVLVHGRPQVLVADRDRGHAQSLAAALRAQQLEVTLVDPSGIPKDMAGLQKYDGIILSNVSAIQLDRSRMALIRDYVRDHGGGLIMIGGDHSFGLGGYYQTPIEEALPVTMDVKQRVDVPNLSIVLSIDRSDSMTTIASGKVTYLDLAKEAAHLVVDLLDENSEVGVMSWDTEWKWEVPLRQARNKAEIHQGIASIVSGGGTEGFPALREAYQVLSKRPAVLKHVIFLTDGQMRRDQFQDLVDRMAKEQITVSSVAVGKWSDERLLVDIAKWGKGRFYKTEDSQTLPRIFAVETQLASNSTVVEQPFKAKLSDPGHEAIQDIDWRSAPPLSGYVATTAKASAEQVLLSHWEDPVLATWRYGLGRTAAFTSDANPRWAGQWIQWREFNKFWAQLVRWTLRSATASGTTATVLRRDRNGEVIIDATDAKGGFINFMDAQVGIVSPDRERNVVDLEQIAPGRYRGRFPAAQEGVYLVGLAQRSDQRDHGSQVAGLVVPYAQELRELGVDEAQLKELSELTGGGALAQPGDAFQKARRSQRVWVDAWPWLAGAAAVLLLLDIAVRRLGAWWLAAIPGFLRRRRSA